MEYTCRVCGEKTECEPLEAREMMYGTRERFHYFECEKCHCMQIVEIPDNLGDYYGRNYYSYQTVEEHAQEEPKTSDERPVLDVGCGSGAFLMKLYQIGMRNLTGCDPFVPQEIEYSNGIKIFKKSIHEMEGQYDFIFMKDSFEHVTDPNEVMESAKRLLSDQGTLNIAVPVYPNIAFDEFGADWYQLDAPRHICIYSRQAMEYLAMAHGLQIVGVEYDSDYGQIIRSFLYSKGVPFWEQTMDIVERYFDKQTIRELSDTSKMANEKGYGDHAQFYLRHREKV